MTDISTSVNTFTPARNARRRCRTWVIAGLAGIAVALSMLSPGVQGVAQADDGTPETTTSATVRTIASQPAG